MAFLHILAWTNLSTHFTVEVMAHCMYSVSSHKKKNYFLRHESYWANENWIFHKNVRNLSNCPWNTKIPILIIFWLLSLEVSNKHVLNFLPQKILKWVSPVSYSFLSAHSFEKCWNKLCNGISGERNNKAASVRSSQTCLKIWSVQLMFSILFLTIPCIP